MQQALEADADSGAIAGPRAATARPLPRGLIGEQPVAPVYEDGAKTVTLKGDNIAAEFIDLVKKYVERHYAVT